MNNAPIYLFKARQRAIRLGGITPFTATDYPGKLTAVLFLQGCPWRCGYCHNPHLQPRTAQSAIKWDDALALLKRRAGLIDAVVFSGGEPTADPMLGQAIEEVKALGFQVGLHTAGAYPKRLEEVLPALDWVGLDIKAPVALYDGITLAAGSGEQAWRCAQQVLESGKAHEFRTTIHPSLLSDEDILHLARTLAGMGASHYVLQLFRSAGCASGSLSSVSMADYPRQSTLDALEAMFASFVFRSQG